MATLGQEDFTALVLSGGMDTLPRPRETSEVERVLNELEAHATEEESFVRSYKEILGRTKDPTVRFLLELIVSDEEKHHAITRAMVATVTGSLMWRRMEGALGNLSGAGEERAELLRVTEGLLRVERRQRKEYKRLLRASEGYYGGLFQVLLRCMVHDSEKHIEVLEFLRKGLGR